MLLAMYQKKEMTVLLKEHGKYCIVKKPVLSLLEEACLFYGSTLQGRTIAAKKILQIHQKVPILVSEKKETLWFPTVSATRDDCIWIHANEVVSYHAKGKRTQAIANVSSCSCVNTSSMRKYEDIFYNFSRK